MRVRRKIRLLCCPLGVAALLLMPPDIIRAQQSTVGNAFQKDCAEISVTGAVDRPIKLQARSQIRLRDALAQAGGPSKIAGPAVRISHTCQCSQCGPQQPSAKDDEYKTAEVVRGVRAANPNLSAGDVVVVSQMDLVYVMAGNPQLKMVVYHEGMGLRQLIAKLGITGYDERSAATISRAFPTGYERLTSCDLRALKEHRAEDVKLRPRDMVVISRWPSDLSWPVPIIRDSPLLPRDYVVPCDTPQLKPLGPAFCRVIP